MQVSLRTTYVSTLWNMGVWECSSQSLKPWILKLKLKTLEQQLRWSSISMLCRVLRISHVWVWKLESICLDDSKCMARDVYAGVRHVDVRTGRGEPINGEGWQLAWHCDWRAHQNWQPCAGTTSFSSLELYVSSNPRWMVTFHWPKLVRPWIAPNSCFIFESLLIQVNIPYEVIWIEKLVWLWSAHRGDGCQRLRLIFCRNQGQKLKGD